MQIGTARRIAIDLVRSGKTQNEHASIENGVVTVADATTCWDVRVDANYRTKIVAMH